MLVNYERTPLPIGHDSVVVGCFIAVSGSLSYNRATRRTAEIG